VDLRRVFFLQLEILGSTMGTRDELVSLAELCAERGIRPVVDSVFPFAQTREAFEKLHSGNIFGKVCLEMVV
jgi:D-arabinose 1-dehydrogenase-like Zn-dependent alcohol dehydrogenase